MSFFDIVTLLGGLALFLYGMTILGNGLERLSGGRLERTLERMTSNLLKAVLLGVVVTAAVQSSSATTVIVVGLVNAGILKLRQAIGVIMGANIGTTVTAHIIRLTDISGENFALQLLSPKTLAPLMAVAGIVMIMAGKRNKIKETGQILMGIGVLFTGLFNMESAVAVLQDSPQVAQLFTVLKNPLLGVLAGRCRYCHYPVLIGLGGYSSGTQRLWTHQFFQCFSHYYGTEYRNLCNPSPLQYRRIKKCQTGGNGSPVF